MAVIVSIRAVSEEVILIEPPLKLSQIGRGVAAQVILVAIPAGFVTIVGNESVIRVLI
jgi:hypothetical protein